MKRIGKPVFFIVAVIILFLTYTSVFGIYGENGDFKLTYIKGINDIRWGIDIKGGVEAVFAPADGVDATDDEMSAVKSILDLRLVQNNVTDYEIYPDYSNDRITVRFPWKSDEKDYDPGEAIKELASTAQLTFRGGTSQDGEVIVSGDDVISAKAVYTQTSDNKLEYVVDLTFSEEGKQKFADGTETYLNQSISIWMDDQLISAPTVSSHITDGKAIITGGGSGGFTADEASDLANKITAGALPFTLKIESFGTISPSLGTYALQAMGIAALAALCLIFLFMCIMYRVPGFVAFIALLGQLSISIMAVSGYFPVFNSFTMTIPGIAGMILSIGMGVDANIITAERIKDELWTGKTLDGCIMNGTKSSLSAIIDGNITIIIVAIILILVFGPANIFSMLFGVSTTGLIYAFGYTLLVGVIANFIMGVGASRLMLRSVSGLKFLRNKRLYGGKKKS
ncbi:MAG: SecD/SecF family protein translocase subunit [Clostridia bacterium]|nr:SecD/SecF family protein translocase subunit [Clostridia bacterium]